MDRQEFLTNFEKASVGVDKAYLLASIERSIQSSMLEPLPRGYKNLVIAMEELSELGQEISKQLRGKCDYYGMVEELADTCLVIAYIKNICNIPDGDISKALNVKLDRLNNVIDKHGKYD